MTVGKRWLLLTALQLLQRCFSVAPSAVLFSELSLVDIVRKFRTEAGAGGTVILLWVVHYWPIAVTAPINDNNRTYKTEKSSIYIYIYSAPPL